MELRTVQIKEVVTKRFRSDMRAWYQNEVHFYKNYPDFCPRLIAHNDETLTMVIEKCISIMDIPDSGKYKNDLWALLHKLHDAGVNHRDIALINVVVHPTRGVLLIDFEHATEDVGEVSVDLFGCVAAGKKNDYMYEMGPDGVYWNGPHDFCPGNYWK